MSLTDLLPTANPLHLLGVGSMAMSIAIILSIRKTFQDKG